MATAPTAAGIGGPGGYKVVCRPSVYSSAVSHGLGRPIGTAAPVGSGPGGASWLVIYTTSHGPPDGRGLLTSTRPPGVATWATVPTVTGGGEVPVSRSTAPDINRVKVATGSTGTMGVTATNTEMGVGLSMGLNIRSSLGGVLDVSTADYGRPGNPAQFKPWQSYRDTGVQHS